MSEFKFPTERIELPSRGLLYPSSSPLSKGYIDLRYLSANEEEVLVNPNYVANDIVIDKLFELMIVDKTIDIGDMFTGDINALFFACRILAYGEEYQFYANNPITGEKDIATADLSGITNKYLSDEHFAKDESGKPIYVNEFEFILPRAKIPVSFKLLSRKERDDIKTEEKGLKKLWPERTFGRSLFLIYSLVSVDGKRDKKTIREFIDRNIMNSLDASQLRKYIYQITPDLETTLDVKFGNGAVLEAVDVPVTQSFLYPELI